MTLRGIIMKAELVEPPHPTQPDEVEMVLVLQGVGPAQPRRVVVPFERLVADHSLDPVSIGGHGVTLEVELDDIGRWVVREIQVAPRRVLREE